MKKRLFVDMDGTIAKWQNVEYFEKLYEEGYYLNLMPQDEAITSIKDIMKQEEYEVYILSAYLDDSKYALKEKQMWLEKYLPEVKKENHIFVKYGDEKSNYIEGGVQAYDYLLDDYTPNLLDFDKQGGNAIKLMNGINHIRGTWQGAKVSINQVQLYEKLLTELSKPTKIEYIQDYLHAREVYQVESSKLQEYMGVESYFQNEKLIVKQQETLSAALYQMNVCRDKIYLRYNVKEKSDFEKFIEDKYIPHTISAEQDHYFSQDEEIEARENEQDEIEL